MSILPPDMDERAFTAFLNDLRGAVGRRLRAHQAC